MTPHAPRAEEGSHSGAASPRQCLSSVLDGHTPDGDALAVQQACALWRDDPQARQDWHAWSLIGDVMRSDELAQPPAHDAAFVARLRQRLAAEPVVLAPVPAASKPAGQRRRAWVFPGAVAAGFVAVAGVLVVARSVPEAQVPAVASTASPGLSPVSVPGAAPSSSAGGARVIRDAQLDSYLRAHQAARGSAAAALPGGGMRNVEVTLSPGTPR